MSDVGPFDAVIFGGRGDLAMRKLLPALYHRHSSRELPVEGRIIAVARRDMTTEQYRSWADEQCRQFISAQEFEPPQWEHFVQRLHYVPVDATDIAGYAALAQVLNEHPERIRMFYLATAPSLFAVSCQGLAKAGLVTPQARVVLEKPLGHDLASAREINRDVGRYFDEEQIYRIDHYLGKETVQNLIALRFGNALFEPMWRREWVQNVQITVAEDIGVENRGGYYDNSGALRDMVQNHLLQVLCIIAMEPPAAMDGDAVRDEKLKVLRALKPLVGADALRLTARGQYRAGAAGGQPVPGYLEEADIPASSRTETFVAVRTEIANWRWAGVPFFLRTGKRLQGRVSEVVINFREVPHQIFEAASGLVEGNRLVVRLQPEESVELHLMAKARGDQMKLRPVSLDLDFAKTFRSRLADAYEPLLMDVLRGKPTLFMRRDEVDAAWTWIEPILDAWENDPKGPRPYTAGTWGPSTATALIERDGFHWYEGNE